jgi:pilus assembly protein CpaF
MEREEIFTAILDHYLRPIADFRVDDRVSEIMINAPDEVYIESKGKVQKTSVRFEDEETLFLIARNLALYTNKRITPITSRFDARLPDGSRVHIILPRCSRKGICISIRRFSRQAFTLAGLVDIGALSTSSREYIEVILHLEKNIIVSGGTGTGKTSFLNALSREIPTTERIIVIEDTSELQLQQPHVLSFETVSADRRGLGGVTIRDLFHSALRMRPDRIIIGECRGGEALDLIQALTSGHGGSLSTLHANSTRDALSRLETMSLMAGVDLPVAALRPQVVSAIQCIIQLNRREDGRRVVDEIAEVCPLTDNGNYHVQPVFLRLGASGELNYSGARSLFCEDIVHKGLQTLIRSNSALFESQEQAHVT